MCYDKRIEKSPKDLKITEEKGDYLASIGEVQNAIKYYNKSKGLTYDKVVKTELLKKIELLMVSQDNILKNMKIIEKTGEFFNFSLVSEETLDLLLGDVLDH
jgi:hypothetical protein